MYESYKTQLFIYDSYHSHPRPCTIYINQNDMYDLYLFFYHQYCMMNRKRGDSERRTKEATASDAQRRRQRASELVDVSRSVCLFFYLQYCMINHKRGDSERCPKELCDWNVSLNDSTVTVISVWKYLTAHFQRWIRRVNST